MGDLNARAMYMIYIWQICEIVELDISHDFAAIFLIQNAQASVDRAFNHKRDYKTNKILIESQQIVFLEQNKSKLMTI